jgi:hypothetical protein
LQERNKSKRRTLKKWLLTFLSVVVTLILVVLLIALASAGAMSFSGKVSNNVFQLKAVGDWLIVGAIIISLILTNFYLVVAGKNKKIKPLGTIASIFNDEMLILGLIPLPVLGLKINPDNVQRVISNTKLFYYSSIVILIVGIVVLMYLLRDYLAKSNWWAFVIALPHVMLGWALQADYQGFKSFIQLSDFSYSKVAKMLQHSDLDLLMVNPTWFKCLAIIIVILVVLMGLVIYEYIWEKTKGWRTKYSKESEKKEG